MLAEDKIPQIMRTHGINTYNVAWQQDPITLTYYSKVPITRIARHVPSTWRIMRMPVVKTTWRPEGRRVLRNGMAP